MDASEWLDTDLDGVGNNADPDDDNDGLNDEFDAFPLDPNEQIDTDDDGTGDNGDNCPEIANVDQLNSDSDAKGNACDADDDNDGLTDITEAELVKRYAQEVYRRNNKNKKKTAEILKVNYRTLTKRLED